MTEQAQYVPGLASGAQVRKDGDKWTLILVRQLRHSPEKVREALTDPAHLREWAPFVVDSSLGTVGAVNITWVGRPQPLETRVTQADAPRLLEHRAPVSISNHDVDNDGSRLCLEGGFRTRLRLCCLAVQYLAEHENEAERGESERKGDT
jgi:uncharacterized protein YndB with AHSA1/START domain